MYKPLNELWTSYMLDLLKPHPKRYSMNLDAANLNFKVMLFFLSLVQ